MSDRLALANRMRAVHDGPGRPLALRAFAGMAALIASVNLVGTVVVGLLLVALNAGTSGHQRVLALVWGLSYGVAAIAFGCVMGLLLQRRTVGWVVAGRTPTRDEALLALRNPFALGVLTGVLWFVGAAYMAVVGFFVGAGGDEIIGLAGGLALAGLTTAALAYVVAARVWRPIAVIALQVVRPDEAMFFTIRSRIMVNWLLATGVPVLGVVLILSAPPGRSHVRGTALFAAVVALVVGGLAMWQIARALGRPLRELTGVLREVGAGRLQQDVEVDDSGEIGMLQVGLNDMLGGLRDRDRIRDMFGRHVGPAVMAETMRSGVTLAGEQRDVVALFVDITGSTALTRTAEPCELVATLNRFFTIVVDAVEAVGGLVNKFEGDAALCVFGAPIGLDDPATAALITARRIRDAVEDAGEVHVGIGVASGPVIAGQVGAASRLEYTVIGDAVNEASRLTDRAKRVDGHVLASEAVVEAAAPEERAHWVKGRTLRLRGRDAPTHTYRAELPAPVTRAG